MHGLSKRQKSRLLAHDLKLRQLAEEERRREEEERLREREMQAVPTLEDMENMQYLRTQYEEPHYQDNVIGGVM